MIITTGSDVVSLRLLYEAPNPYMQTDEKEPNSKVSSKC